MLIYDTSVRTSVSICAAGFSRAPKVHRCMIGMPLACTGCNIYSIGRFTYMSRIIYIYGRESQLVRTDMYKEGVKLYCILSGERIVGHENRVNPNK